MEQETPKTANQLYRESGTTLSFKEWIEREKAKGTEMMNKDIADAIARLDGSSDSEKRQVPTTWYGLNKNVFVFGAVVVGAAIVYTIYKRRKK